MKPEHVSEDLSSILFTKEQIAEKVHDLAQQIDRDYEGRQVLLVGVLKGAVMVMADLMRELEGQYPMDWMAVSSYGSGTKSSGVVRILKDLDTDLHGKDVLIVEDIIDSGLTLSWLRTNLESRGPNSVEICTLLRAGGLRSRRAARRWRMWGPEPWSAPAPRDRRDPGIPDDDAALRGHARLPAASCPLPVNAGTGGVA